MVKTASVTMLAEFEFLVDGGGLITISLLLNWSQVGLKYITSKLIDY